MVKVLFVVHRYAPFPGGSEYFVRDMSEEGLHRGWDVTVLANEHKGDLNGVKVTNDYNILGQKWDLIVVHGGDVVSQNIVHYNAFGINKNSPVLYMIIKPSTSVICMNGIKHHKFLGYSTSADISFLQSQGVTEKARRVRHGIVPETTIMTKNVDPVKKVYVSAGGFWPHKAMNALAAAFQTYTPENYELQLFGYGSPETAPLPSSKVRVLYGESRTTVMQAIADASGYIMNSYEEGFGLVLLEAMMNKTPWQARDIAGAHDLKNYGYVYKDEKELCFNLTQHKDVGAAYNFAMAHHTITNTVNDIEDILNELY